jgi:hypothetical protein
VSLSEAETVAVKGNVAFKKVNSHETVEHNFSIDFDTILIRTRIIIKRAEIGKEEPSSYLFVSEPGEMLLKSVDFFYMSEESGKLLFVYWERGLTSGLSVFGLDTSGHVGKLFENTSQSGYVVAGIEPKAYKNIISINAKTYDAKAKVDIYSYVSGHIVKTAEYVTPNPPKFFLLSAEKSQDKPKGAG